MVDKKYYKIHTLPSLFKWWLRFWPVVEEDPWEAGHVQVLWIYQVRERTSLFEHLSYNVSFSEDLAVCVRCRRKMPDDVKILDDPSYKPKPDSTELMGTKKLRLARYKYINDNIYVCSWLMTHLDTQTTGKA